MILLHIFPGISQLTVGGLALMCLVPATEIGLGFFGPALPFYLPIWVCVVAGTEAARPWELLGFALFTLVFLGALM